MVIFALAMVVEAVGLVSVTVPLRAQQPAKGTTGVICAGGVGPVGLELLQAALIAIAMIARYCLVIFILAAWRGQASLSVRLGTPRWRWPKRFAVKPAA